MQEKELQALTVSKLKELCQEKDIKVGSKDKKADLVAKILAATAPPALASPKKTPGTAAKGKTAPPPAAEEAEEAPPLAAAAPKSAKKSAATPATARKRKAEKEEEEEGGGPPVSVKPSAKKQRQEEEVEDMVVGDELPADLLAQVAAHQSQKKAASVQQKKAKDLKQKKQSRLEERKQFKKQALEGEVEAGPVRVQVLGEEGGRPAAPSLPAQAFLKDRLQNKVKRSAAMVPPRGVQSKLSAGAKQANQRPAANFAGAANARKAGLPAWR